jgi:glutaredoxin
MQRLVPFARRACFPLALGALGALGACHHKDVMSPAELERMHDQCANSLANGTMKLHPTSQVGFAPEKPPGTPVVIYGASWCGACDDAAEYMTMQHIPFVERDIDDSAVEAEAERALAAASLPPTLHSLPVVDVRGTVTIGFIPCVIEAAWRGGRDAAPTSSRTATIHP